MKKVLFSFILTCLTVLPCASQVSFSQTDLSDIISWFKSKGYSIKSEDNHVTASRAGEKYNVGVSTNQGLSVLSISTGLKKYPCPSRDPSVGYATVNELNGSIPMFKFILHCTYAGDAALLLPDLDEWDVTEMEIRADFTTLYTSDKLIFILDDSVNTFKQIKANMPADLE